MPGSVSVRYAADMIQCPVCGHGVRDPIPEHQRRTMETSVQVRYVRCEASGHSHEQAELLPIAKARHILRGRP